MRKSTVFLIFVLPLVTGCFGNKNNDISGLQGVNGGMAQDMAAERSAFERMEDPPLNADTHFAAGQLNETQGTIPVAVQQYEAALKLNPRHVPSLFRLAMLYSQQKQYVDGVRIWRRYIAATNESANGYSNLAFCQELAGDAKGAEVSYLAGIKRDPKNQACHVNYGLMLMRHGRVDEARVQFAVVLTPAQVHYNVASVYQILGKKAEAKAEYTEAIKLDPNFMDAQARLAALEKN